jgi:hypothetical protein
LAPQPAAAAAFELLPAGDYVGQVIESEVVLTKAGTGTILKRIFSSRLIGPSSRSLARAKPAASGVLLISGG